MRERDKEVGYENKLTFLSIYVSSTFYCKLVDLLVGWLVCRCHKFLNKNSGSYTSMRLSEAHLFIMMIDKMKKILAYTCKYHADVCVVKDELDREGST